MAFGGGTWTVQNKVLPGAYINFITNATSNQFGERGTGCIGALLNWFGDEPVVVTADEIMGNCKKLFGYSYSSPQMMFVREFFKHGNKLICGCVASNFSKAAGTVKGGYPIPLEATKYGVRGNDIQVRITKNVDDTEKFDVLTYLGGEVVAKAIGVSNVDDSLNNDFVNFKEGSANIDPGDYNLSGGTGSGEDTQIDVEAFLEKAEQYAFNAFALCDVVYNDSYNVKDYMKPYRSLVHSWCKRLRDDRGIKFQVVINGGANDYDYEGTVVCPQNINLLTDSGKEMSSKSLISAWICGALAGCPVNKSLTNTTYDGELVIKADSRYSQSELENKLNGGYFVFHYVNDDMRVLSDINSFVSTTTEKGEVFKSNQTVRVIDQIAVDTAAIFNNHYLGKVQNDETGRSGFWNDLVKNRQDLANIRAITNFNGDDINVSQGDSKGTVVVTEAVQVVNAMDKLYMTCTIG